MTKLLTNKMIMLFNKKLFLEEKSRLTIDKYIRDINKFYIFLDKDKHITREAIQRYKLQLMQDYKASSVNSMLISLNIFLKFVGLQEFHIRLLKVQRRAFGDRNREISENEYNRLINASKHSGNEKLQLLMETICSTGIRVSELQFITVESVIQRRTIINHKGKIREIYLPKKLVRKLERYCRSLGIITGQIFITKNGNPIDRSNIWKMMNKLCEIAEVDKNKVFPHNLRHLFALKFYQVEKDIIRLADVLGHNNIETTRIYTNTYSFDYEKIYQKMNLVANC